MTTPTHSADKSGEAGRLTGFTRGVAYVRDEPNVHDVVTDENGVICCAPEAYLKESRRNWPANAALIAEAFTVANETGLTPRELAERCARLVEALEVIRDEPHCMVNDSESLRHTLKTISRIAAIALSRATPPQTDETK